MTTPIPTLRIAIAGAFLAGAMAAPATAAPPSVVPETCPAEAEAADCGHVDVPFDRARPSAGTIPVAFERYRHTDPGPAESAIIFNFGGPGVSTTALRDILGGWEPLRDKHDLLLIDSRGTGRSALIDCPDFQTGNGPRVIALAAGCAAQLGDAADRYSTADIADDYDAVRAALGYAHVDFVGNSYGGVNAAAYATRHGEHLRTLVLNGGVEPAMDPFLRGSDGTRRIVERVGTICERSPNCGRSAARAIHAVGRLLRHLRRAPVRGTALDAHGDPHQVTIDPGSLLVHVLDNTDGFGLTHGETAAAADALERGDAKPLLRLAAEGDFPIVGDNGDVNVYSAGANAATFCLDNPWPWSPSAPLTVRKRQWAAAVRRAPDAPFAPFRAEEVMFSIYGMADPCLPWPASGTRLAVEPGARYPTAPTLVLDGEFDTNVGRADVNAAHYPNATLVRFTGINHTPLEWSPCAYQITLEFLRTRGVRDTGCASQPLYDNPGVRTFPRLVRESPPATPRRGNRANLRLARVGADAAIDAFKRGFMNVVTGGDGHAPGLRGGTIQVDAGDSWTATLDGIRWTNDVTVSGTLHWSFDGGPLDADLQIDGPGRQDGSLHLRGGWLIHGAPRTISITGTLHGRRVEATVPSS
jgi:pimeloyl-ACP methyl ester carboxylesterase